MLFNLESAHFLYPIASSCRLHILLYVTLASWISCMILMFYFWHSEDVSTEMPLHDSVDYEGVKVYFILFLTYFIYFLLSQTAAFTKIRSEAVQGTSWRKPTISKEEEEAGQDRGTQLCYLQKVQGNHLLFESRGITKE